VLNRLGQKQVAMIAQTAGDLPAEVMADSR
jgi:hypothetical protein